MNELPTARIIRRYRKISLITIGAVVFLILVGGIVRSMGAGMGCPDWPKCFGMWIPPTDVSQLPDNYQELYGDHGYGSTVFNVVKTWTEYLNRLIGVVIGFLIIATYYFSRPLRRYDARIHWLSLAALLLVIFQGWLGGQVVDTNLTVWMISIHMLVALMILLVLSTAVLFAFRSQIVAVKVPIHKAAVWMGGLVLVLTLTQILLGIQVRESVDEVAKQLGAGNRREWIDALSAVYRVHRYFYYLVVAGLGAWLWMIRDAMQTTALYRTMGLSLIAVVGLEVLMGLTLHHFSIAPFAQPLHLTLAAVLFGMEFCLTGMLILNQSGGAIEEADKHELSHVL